MPEGDEAKFDGLSDAYSHLYLAISGELAAVVCISDPLRAEAADAVRALHEQGIAHIVMMTGDNERRLPPWRAPSVWMNTTPVSCRRTRRPTSAPAAPRATRSS